MALVAAYTLSLISAVHMRGAIGELFKAATYFMVYWIAFRAVRGERDLDRLLHVAYAAGVGVAVKVRPEWYPDAPFKPLIGSSSAFSKKRVF